MRVLCVAEKPSIAKSITEILSGGHWDSRNGMHKYCKNFDFPYKLPPPLGPQHGDSAFTVTSVLGHLTSNDFGENHRKWGSCDPFDLFDAPVVNFVTPDHKQVERNLQNEARRANLLLIWTDCDREGEHIGSEIVAACRKANPRIIVKRARFSAIIAAQIHQACRQANDLDMRMANAVEARIELDLRIGAAFTRLMTTYLKSKIPELAENLVSYGPCQFPTLGFVVDQYNRVQSFVPEPFWHIAVSSERDSEEEDGEPTIVAFAWRRNHLFDLPVAMLLYEQCIEHPMATVQKVETKPTSRWKPLPLTTVELQQSGSRLLGMTPKRVLDLAEKLYQKGFLSYPRTETDQYDKDFDFDSLIRKQTYDNVWGTYAQKLLDGAYERPRNGKKNDKAHPPIHPTGSANNLEADERRVYELVTRRFLASCSSNAQGKQTTVEIEIAGEFFHTSGVVITARNYLEVYPYDKWASNPIPDFEEGEQFMPSACELKEGSTTRPNLLTEADLVGLMDKNGIGTDATIAEHIAKIIDREYVLTRQEGKTKYLVPSTLGIGLVEGFNSIGFDRSLSKPHLRRETEHRMQLICEGTQVKREVLDASIEEYKGVYVKARQELDTVVNAVVDYLHGEGEAQEAVRAAARSRGRGRGAARGARGTRGRGGEARGRGDEDDDDDGDPPAGGGQGRGTRGTRGTRARGSTSTRGTSTRGRGGSSAAPRKRKSDDPGPGDGDVPHCTCGAPAQTLTAGPNSNNPGRQFYKCSKPKEEQCDFFEWLDAGNDARASSSRGNSSRDHPAPKRPRSAASGNGRIKRCECGLEAISRTVTKSGPNNGRQFWACPSNKNAACGYFEWDDESDAGPSGSGGGGGGGGGGAASGGSGECFKCGQEGHWSRDCPNEGGGPSRSRSAAGGSGGGGGGGGGSGACFKCGEEGHWSNACPHENGGPSAPRGGGRGNGGAGGSRGANRGGAASSTGCYKCGGDGHWANACPNA